MKRGQHHRPCETTVELFSASTKQTGLLPAIFGTENFNKHTRQRELLFEVGLQPEVVGSVYTLLISVDGDYNFDFKLLCHDNGLYDGVVQAEIHFSTSRVIDLENGNFKGVTEKRKKDWLLRRCTDGELEEKFWGQPD
jgi:hypothetical protein